MKERRLGYLLCLPAIGAIVLIELFPIGFSFFLSLFNINLKMPASTRTFVGLSNYFRLLSDQRMWISLFQTFRIVLISVALELGLGMKIAHILNRVFRFRSLVRAAALIPWAIPTVISGMLWSWFFNDQFGIANAILYRLGFIREYIPWLGTPALATFSIIAAEVWKATPFMALLLLAGLQMIPQELYEAATIDGASRRQVFWSVTLPLLRPAVLIALLFRTLDAFRIFDLVFVMTAGGPGNSTETISLYTYKRLFSFLDFGYGSSLAVWTFLCTLAFSAMFILPLIRCINPLPMRVRQLCQKLRSL